MVTLREHRETIEELLELFRHEYYVYSPELFDLRMKEERLRADLMQTTFSYLEICFEDLFTDQLERSDLKPLWRSMMHALRLLVRGSDVKGFLHDNRGLGVLFLDTATPPIARVFAAFRRHLTSAGLNRYLKHDLQISRFTTWVYVGKGLAIEEKSVVEKEPTEATSPDGAPA